MQKWPTPTAVFAKRRHVGGIRTHWTLLEKIHVPESCAKDDLMSPVAFDRYGDPLDLAADLRGTGELAELGRRKRQFGQREPECLVGDHPGSILGPVLQGDRIENRN